MPPVAVAFDFEKRVEGEIPIDQIRPAIAEGRFVWLDVDGSEPELTREVLLRAVPVTDEVLKECLSPEEESPYNLHDDCLHFVLTNARLHPEEGLEPIKVDVVIGEKYLLTVRRGRIGFMEKVRKHYHTDFVRFARSPSFLLYELWDRLIESYERVTDALGERVEKVQTELFGEVDDTIFGRVSRLGTDLLHFRKVLVQARGTLHELSSRKSAFVSEATQPFLGGMVGSLERLLQDLIVDRDILSESLSLYMSIVSHRTNKVMSRLTVVSLIFLPLTFLCGVYGMNFEYLPEFKWELGYIWFWSIVAAIVTVVVLISKRLKLF